MGFKKLIFFLSIFGLYLTGCAEKISPIGNGISLEELELLSSTSCSGGNTVAYKLYTQNSGSTLIQNSQVAVKLNGLNVGSVQEISTGVFEIKNLFAGGPYTIEVTHNNNGLYCPVTISNLSVLSQGPPCNSIIQGSDIVLHLQSVTNLNQCGNDVEVNGNGTIIINNGSETVESG